MTKLVTASGVSVILVRNAVAIRDLVKRTRENIVEIGCRLAEVRENIDHGVWLDWLETEFDWSDQTARNFIHIFELDRDGKFKNILNLDLPLSLLYRVAAPKAEAVRTEIAERIDAGEQPSAAMVREIIDQAKSESGGAEDSAQSEEDEGTRRHRAAMAAIGAESEPSDLATEAAAKAKHLVADDHQVGRAGPANDTPAPAAVTGAPSAKASKKNGRPEACDDEVIRELVLDEFFAVASGADIYDHIPADRRAEVAGAFLDRLTAKVMCEVMSPEFGEQLRARMPAPKRKSDKPFKHTLNLEANSTRQERGNRSRH
jgi:hypothetical protein